MRSWQQLGSAVALTSVVVTAALLATPGPQERSRLPPSLENVVFEPGQYVLGVVCGACHKDIYRVWRDSIHARSFRDPAFQSALAQARELAGPSAAEGCLACHAPASLMVEAKAANDLRLLEGVGCTFCHAMRGADLDRFPPFDLEPGHVKLGPLRDAASPIHETRYSSFVESAAFCATCHEYRSPAGATVLATFTEYARGPYHQRLVACQDCHMPSVLGWTVAEHVRRTGRSGFVGFHAIPGGHSVWQVRRAVEVELLAIERGSGSVGVRVAIENRAAGHWLPTGMPSRRLVLEVTTEWDGRVHRRRLELGRKVVDKDGRSLASVAEMILLGARVVQDTRLRPGERREVRLTLPAPERARAKLVVRLIYESTETPDRPPIAEDVVRIERTI